MDNTNINLLTGFYMNFCSLSEKYHFDLFIILNEANGKPSEQTINRVEKLVRGYFSSHKESEIRKSELYELIQHEFAYGVQVFLHNANVKLYLTIGRVFRFVRISLQKISMR